MHNKSRSQRDMSHAVLFATGPWLLRDAFKAFTGEAGELSVGYAREHEVKGTRIMVYSLGQWYAALHSHGAPDGMQERMPLPVHKQTAQQCVHHRGQAAGCRAVGLSVRLTCFVTPGATR